MAKYRITSPDGGKWDVTAPDDATEEQVLNYAKSQWDQDKTVTEPPAEKPSPSRLEQLSEMNKEFGKGTIRGLAGAGEMYSSAVPGLLPLGMQPAAEAVVGVAKPLWQRVLEYMKPGYSEQLSGSVMDDKDRRFAGTTGELLGYGLSAGALQPGTALAGASGEYLAGDIGKLLGITVPAAGSAINAARKLIAHKVLTAGHPVAETAQLFKEQGITPVPQAIAPSQPVLAASTWASRSPGGEGIMAAQAERASSELQSAINATRASELGLAKEPYLIGEKIVSDVKQFVPNLRKSFETEIAPVSKFMTNKPVPLTNFMSVIKRRSAEIKGFEGTAEAIKARDPLMVEISKLQKSSEAPFESVKQMRSMVGELRGDAGQVTTLSKEALKEVYGALTKDMQAAIGDRGGQGLLATFNKANSNYSDGLKLYGKMLKPMLEKVTPEEAMRAAQTNMDLGPTRLLALKKGVTPETFDSFVSGTIYKMGLETKGAGQETVRQFSPRTFLSSYRALPDESRDILFSNTTVRKNLEEIAKIDSILQRSGNYMKAPGSGKEAHLMAMGSSMPTALAFILGGNVGVGLSVAGGALGTGIGATKVSKLMTDPKFTTWLLEGGKVPVNKFAGHAVRLMSIADKERDPEKKRAMVEFAQQFIGPRRIYSQQPEAK